MSIDVEQIAGKLKGKLGSQTNNRGGAQSEHPLCSLSRLEGRAVHPGPLLCLMGP